MRSRAWAYLAILLFMGGPTLLFAQQQTVPAGGSNPENAPLQEGAPAQERAPIQSWGSTYAPSGGEFSYSYDQQIATNPAEANPYLVNRNIISTSPPSLLIGSLALSYERLLSRVVGLSFGVNFHHSNLKSDFESMERNLNSKSYAVTAGGQLGLVFYTDKRYAQGFFLAILTGGGIILGQYSPTGDQNNLVSLEDFYGALTFRLGYRFVWQNFAITPTFGFGLNLVIYNEGDAISEPRKVPVYYTLSTFNDIFSRHSPFNIFNDPTLMAFAFGGVGLEFSIVF